MPTNDVNVPFVSGSARSDAMVIVPCSMSTPRPIATGYGQSALLRAADVFLKERRKLIVVPRETPWSLIQARQCRDLNRGRRNRSCPLSRRFTAIPKRQRRRGHGSVAHSRSAWVAQFESLPLGKRKRSSTANLKLDPESFVTAHSCRIWISPAAVVGTDVAL